MCRSHVAERRGVSDLRQNVIEGLASSSRYRHLSADLLARTADWAVARHAKPGPALKAAKRKLHQVFGAYAVKLDSLKRHLDALETGDETRAVCRRILRLHHSTAERLSFVETFHATIWNHCGTPRHILDLAAGLNAFSLPFSGLDPAVSYTAVEIDRRMVDAVRRFLAITQRPGGCLWQDLLGGVLPGDADVALVLKTLPCLERQKPGAAVDLMHRLEDIPKVVVSYPVRSLGGARKNMPQTYRAQAQSLAATCGRDITFLDLSQEIVAVLSHR